MDITVLNQFLKKYSKFLKAPIIVTVLSIFSYLFVFYLYTNSIIDSSLYGLFIELIKAFFIAGIAYILFELYGKKELIDEIKVELMVDADIKRLNIKKIYKDRKDERFKNDVIKAILDTQNAEIKIAGIAIPEILTYHKEMTLEYLEKLTVDKCPDIGTALYKKIRSNYGKINVQILLANSYNKNTIGYRYIFEVVLKNENPNEPNKKIKEVFDANDKNIKIAQINDKLNKSINIDAANKIVNDINDSINQIMEEKKGLNQNHSVSLRLYDPHPICFLIIVNKTIFIEPYTLAGRGGDNIILQLQEVDQPLYYKNYLNHFNNLWELSSMNEVTDKESLEEIKKRYTGMIIAIGNVMTPL